MFVVEQALCFLPVLVQQLEEVHGLVVFIVRMDKSPVNEWIYWIFKSYINEKIFYSAYLGAYVRFCSDLGQTCKFFPLIFILILLFFSYIIKLNVLPGFLNY